MSTNANAGLSTTISWAGSTIADVTKINGFEITADPIEATNLDSTFKEYIPGIPDAGTLDIEGNFYPGDTNGQKALYTAIGARTTGQVVITWPSKMGATFTFTGLVTKFAAGDADTEGKIPFSASFQITGSPTLGISASTGMSAFMVRKADDSAEATAANYMPAWAIGTYTYAVSYTTETSVRIRPTAGSHTIKIYIDDVYTESVSSGVSSSAIAIDADSSKRIRVEVYESGKTAKNYYITLARIS